VGLPHNAMDRQSQLTTQFLANRHSLFAFIYGFIRNTQDAEDLFQEVWVRFSEAVSRGVEIEQPAQWCRGTARNLVLHYWRERRNDQVVVDPELMDYVELAFAEQETRSDYWLARQQALHECLEALPPHSKSLLRLKYEQGLTAQKVAEQLTQSVAGVLMALSRVRQLLRECAHRKLKVLGLET
jgi:RNA polymerase sigma-70 factor, ECF subfamily